MDLCHPGGEGGEGGVIFILLVFLLVFRIVFRISVVVVIGIVARGSEANGEKRDEDAARYSLSNGIRALYTCSNTPLVLPPLSTHLTVITHVNTSFIYSCNIVTTCSRVYHW